MKILMIDDERLHAILTAEVLKQIKHSQVLIAADAFDGFALLIAARDIKCIVVDYNMPYVNGGDFTRKVRSMAGCEDIPIIISTSLDDIEEKMVDVSGCSVIKKPYSKNSLLELVESAIGQHQ